MTQITLNTITRTVPKFQKLDLNYQIQLSRQAKLCNGDFMPNSDKTGFVAQCTTIRFAVKPTTLAQLNSLLLAYGWSIYTDKNG